ncbi:MAG: archaellin/type IV pilin N-terminal domain-containing protein [Nanoarchaeota archaeon]|nr:archaellin/type IV pilin N-terminal domain-containing protein [Nanoarchaeota archaeon]
MKRAMSPVFSTILLIGFAIALGGIVMSWGASGYVQEEKIEGCDATSLSLVSYGENNGVCSDGSSLIFTIQNNGETDLSGVKVFVVGDNDVYSNVIEQHISVADVVRLNLVYANVGNVEKLLFVPRFSSLSGENLCPKHGFSVEEVGEC